MRTTSGTQPRLPRVLVEDADEVAWALDIALSLGQRGDAQACLVWLRRAAQSAALAELDARAVELAESAMAWSQWVRESEQAEAKLVQPRRAAGRAAGGQVNVTRTVRLDTRNLAPVALEPVPPGSTRQRPPSLPAPSSFSTRPPPRRATSIPPAPSSRAPRLESLPPSSIAPSSTEGLQLALAGCPALHSLSNGLRASMAQTAEHGTLARGEEIGVEGLLLVLSGELTVTAVVSDTAVSHLVPGELLAGKNSLGLPLALRCVAASDEAQVLRWNEPELSLLLLGEDPLTARLQGGSDVLHAACGATLGPLGEQLEPEVFCDLLGTMQLHTLQPGAVWIRAGAVLPGIVLLGLGSLQHGDARFAPGQTPLAEQALACTPLERDLIAGDGGALVWMASRAALYELLARSPRLLEILSQPDW